MQLLAKMRKEKATVEEYYNDHHLQTVQLHIPCCLLLQAPPCCVLLVLIAASPHAVLLQIELKKTIVKHKLRLLGRIASKTTNSAANMSTSSLLGVVSMAHSNAVGKPLPTRTFTVLQCLAALRSCPHHGAWCQLSSCVRTCFDSDWQARHFYLHKPSRSRMRAAVVADRRRVQIPRRDPPQASPSCLCQ